MMGHSHSVAAGAAFVALASPAPYALGILDMSPSSMLAGTLICCGAGLIPDLDHKMAGPAWSLPPVSKWITSFIGNISGGHRHATHSLGGVAVATALAWLVGLITVTLPHLGRVPAGAALMSVVLGALAAKSLRIVRGWKTAWLSGIATGLFVAAFGPTDTWWWLPSIVLIGSLTHLVTDAATTGGIAWLYPWRPAPPDWWKWRGLPLPAWWALFGVFCAAGFAPQLVAAASGRTPPSWISENLSAYFVAVIVLMTALGWKWQQNGWSGAPVVGTAGSWIENAVITAVAVYLLVGVLDVSVAAVADADANAVTTWISETMTRLVEGRR